jgi:hypothetical protein
MKCFITAILALLFSFGVQAASTVNSTPDQAANNSKNDRQFFLPSGSAAIPVNVSDDKEKNTKPVKDKRADSIKEKWGVGEFVVRHTSAGYMLDLRYRVFDKEKAKPLFSRKLRPFIIEEASRIKYGVPASPKVGFLRQAPTHIKENKVYFMFFANPGKRIKTGDKLTLVIGDFRIENLTVE